MSDQAYNDKLSTLKELIDSYWYVTQTDQGLFFDFSNASGANKDQKPNHLAYTFFNQVFEKDYFIKGLFKNPQLINAIFDFQLPTTKPIHIGSELLPISTKELESYKPPTVDPSAKFATFEFPKMQQEGEKIHFKLREDILIAQLWKHRVRYGLDFAMLEKGLKYNILQLELESGKLEIAKQRDPLPPVPAKREDSKEKLERDLSPEVDEAGHVDMYKFKNAIFHIKSGEILYKKIPGKAGKSGRDVMGNSIASEAPEDTINLAMLCGEGTEVKEIEGAQCLITTRDGTLNVQSDGRVSVHSGIRVQQVDTSTGNLEVDMPDQDMTIEEDIDDSRKVDVNVRTLTIRGKIYGSEITAHGNTRVVLENGMIKGKIIHTGTGPIIVNSKLTAVEIHSELGIVSVEESENCTILGNVIKVKSHYHGVMIGASVKITNLSNTQDGNTFVMAEQIEINAITGGGEIGITCLWKRNLKLAQEAAKQSDKIHTLMEETKSYKEQLIAYIREHKEEITLYKQIETKLQNPQTPDELKGKLFLKKKQLFSKTVQSQRNLEAEITSRQEVLKKEQESLLNADTDLKNYYIHLLNIEFSGDLFTHIYQMDSKIEWFYAIGLKKLEHIARTRMIPTGSEGAAFTDLNARPERSFRWNAYEHFQNPSQE